MKKINKIGMMIAVGTMLAATSCSDFSDYNSFQADSNAMAGKTLWQNISENEKLQNFAKLVEKSGFSETLNSPRYYTVWAPVDGTYDAQAWLAKPDSAILKQFVKQHVAEYSHLISGEVSDRILSLNEKKHDFTTDAFDEAQINTANLPSSNGILHAVNGISQYKLNIYEKLDSIKGCDSLVNFIRKYDYNELDVDNSILGPIVNGEQTYYEKTYKKKNNIISKIINAEMENEDSTYTMLFPNDDAWTKAYTNIYSRYKFVDKLKFMDLSSTSSVSTSIKATEGTATTNMTSASYYQDSLSVNGILENLAFSNNDTRNVSLTTEQVRTTEPLDTLHSTSKGRLTNPQDIINHTLYKESASNGTVRVIDSLVMYPWETYEPVISTRRPDRFLNCKDDKVTTYNYAQSLLAQRDTLWAPMPNFIKERLLPKSSEYFTYSVGSPSGNSSKPDFAFALENVLSTTYHIYVVLVPEHVFNDSTALNKEGHYVFNLSYTDETNTQCLVNLPLASTEYGVTSEKLSSKNNNYTSKDKTVYGVVTVPGKICLVDLGEFTFPVSYYNQKTDANVKASPTLFMGHTKTFTTTSNRNKFDQEMRVAGVYLYPVAAKNYYENLYK